MASLNLFELYATIGIKMDEFEQGIDRAQKKFKSFSDNISGLSGKIDSAYKGMGDVLKPAVDGFQAVENVGKKAGNAITTGLKGFAAASTVVGGFGAAAVKAGAEFDSSMSTVQALSGATGDELTALRDKAIEMGAKTKFSAKEAADAMTYMGMAGWKTEDMLGGIAGIMSLAAASGEDLATTSDIVTDALTAFGMKASDSGRFADVLAVAATNANTDVGMMGETFKYVAPIAGTMGYSVEDAALAIGLMANSSIKSSMAGTALRSIITRLSTDAGASSKKLGALGTLTEKLGVEFYNADGSARALNDVLMEARSVWQGLTAEQKINYANVIAGQEALAGWNAIMNASDEDVQKLTSSIADCNGAADKMSKIKLDNLAGDITYLQSAFGSLQIAISDSLTPTLREFAQFGQKAMAGLLDGFQGGGVSGFMSALSGIVTEGATMLAQKAPEFASVSLQFIQALAYGLIDAAPEILSSAGSVVEILIGGVFDAAVNHGNEINEVGKNIIEFVCNGFSQATEAIGYAIDEFMPLLVEGFLSYHETLFNTGIEILGWIGEGILNNKEGIQSAASETITNMVTALRDNAPSIIEGGIALLEALVGAIEENMPLILETGGIIIGKLIEGISTASPGVQAIIATAVLPHILKIVDTVGKIGGAVSSVASLASGAINTVLGIGGKLMGGIKALWGLLMTNPIGQVITVIGLLVAAFVTLWNNCEAFRNFWIGLWEGLKSVVSTAIDAIVGFFTGIIDFVKNNWQGLLLMIVNPFAGAFKLIYDNCEAFREFVDGLMEAVGEIFAAGWEAVKGFFVGAWESVQSAWGAAVDFFAGIGDGIHAAFEAVTGFLGDAFSAAWDVISGIWGAAVDFFSGVWDGITGVFGGVSGWFGDMFSKAWNAVTSAWDGATEFFGGIWDRITGVFANVWDKFKEIGGNIVKGLWDGVARAWDGFIRFITGKVGGIVDAVKNMLGIHSPSRVFAGIGGNMALGLAEGWDDEYGDIKRQIENGLNFGTATVGLNANYSGTTRHGAQEAPQSVRNGAGNTYVTINSPVAVDAVQAAREWQKTAQRMALGYV